MGKKYPQFNSEKFDLPEGKFTEDLCSANGTYCLAGCTYKETKSCKRLELKQKQMK